MIIRSLLLTLAIFFDDFASLWPVHSGVYGVRLDY
jgi:hypothetical protein